MAVGGSCQCLPDRESHIYASPVWPHTHLFCGFLFRQKSGRGRERLSFIEGFPLLSLFFFKVDAWFFNRFPLGHLSPLNGARWALTFWLKKGFKPFFLSQTDVRRVEAEVSVAPVTTLSDWTGGEKCNWGGMRRSPVRVKQQEIICTSCLPPYTHTRTHALSRALNMFKKQTFNAKFNGAVLP